MLSNRNSFDLQSNVRKWIYLRKPSGGAWQEVRGDVMEADWNRCLKSLELPVAREFKNSSKSSGTRFVVENGWVVDTFHEVGVRVASIDQHAIQFAKMHLEALVNQHLVIGAKTNV